MSNLFLKEDFESIFNSTTESNVSLPKWIKVIDVASNQSNSATSPASVQNGGNFSATSNISSSKDVNKLISMLTSDTSSIKQKTVSETTTASLENQLRNILEKEGGGKKKKSKKQKGGSDEIENIENIKSFFTTLKSQGVNVDIKLNNKTMSDFFGGADNTTTDIQFQNNLIGSATSSFIPQSYNGSETSNVVPQSYNGSETSSVVPQSYNGSATSSAVPQSYNGSATSSAVPQSYNGSATSSAVPQSYNGSETSSENANIIDELTGGAKKGKKSSKKMEGGVNPGFQAFLDLKKHVASKLGISNGPQAAKVAGAVQKEVKEKYPELNAVKVAEEGRKHFDKNVDHFKQMLN